MADIKRLHYFDHQFLVEADFTDEQTYHLGMRRRHNKVLHTFGVAEGLQVEKTGDKEVTVGAGTAVDRDGRELVLDTDKIIDLSTFSGGDDIYVTIAYDEQETDPTTATGVTGNTRVTETPQVQAATSAPPGDGSIIRLANFTLTGGGNVPGNNGVTFDAGLRQFAGSSVAPNTIGTRELANGAVTGDKIADNAITAAKIADLSISAADLANNSINESKLADNAVSNRTIADLAVTGNKIANNAVTSGKIANGAVGRADIATGAVIETNLANNAVTGTKIADGTIGEMKLDSSTRGKLVTNGNAHDHSGGDGAQIRHSRLNLDGGRNPHGINAADVGALSINGGVINGRTNFYPYAAGNRSHVGIGWSTGSEEISLGVWADATHRDGIFIYHYGGNTSYALRINSGKAYFGGGKEGFVTDRFVNTSEATLHAGDVVRLKDSGVVRFHGDLNSIPVCEVTLSDIENDPSVIGIVDSEALPLYESPDERTNPEDPFSIPSGGELMVVTLGSYARCKVDATEEPIKTGDLLTSSKNPGHAKKATDPKIGCIIGKALEPLKEGTGYIAVFVNIQ